MKITDFYLNIKLDQAHLDLIEEIKLNSKERAVSYYGDCVYLSKSGFNFCWRIDLEIVKSLIKLKVLIKESDTRYVISSEF